MNKNDDRGAAAVEFAIVMIPLLLLITGLINFGQAFFTQISLDHAAREGVRYAAVGAVATKAEERAKLAAPSVSDDVVAKLDMACPQLPTQPITMTVKTKLKFWAPFPGFKTIDLSAKGVAACYETK